MTKEQTQMSLTFTIKIQFQIGDTARTGLEDDTQDIPQFIIAF